nr:reverse transcriptase domain-containing protein [Tanacetum cinerariifolium]
MVEDEVDKDDDEEPEEGDDEEEEMEINDEVDNPKVIDPDEPPPPVFQFCHNFYVRESSSTRALLDCNSKVFAPGPKCSDLMIIHKRTTKLERPCIPERLQFQEEPPIPLAFSPRANDPYVMARDATMAAQEDDDDDAAVSKDLQPLESHGSPCDVGLYRWFEKMENTFEIKVQRFEDKLRHLKLRDMNIAAYTKRFNELALLCPDAVPNKKKKVELYIKGLPEIIKGETTSSRPATLNEAVRMAHALMEQKI